jgi:chromosome partitioning protein
MYIVTVASQKGGAGKTTLTAHLAVAAVMKGIKAVVIDTDPQASLARWWNDRVAEDLPFLSSTVDELPERIEQLRDEGFEMLFIDTPPAVTELIKNVVRMSDIVIIPTKPSPLDIHAVSKTVDIVDECEKPMIFVVSIATKAAKITSETATLLSQFGTVAPVHIGNRQDFALCMIDGRTVMEVYPGTKSDQEITELFKYVETQIKRKVK